MRKYLFIMVLLLIGEWVSAQDVYHLLNFYADNGFVHDSQQAGLDFIEDLGSRNGWEVFTTNDTSVFSLEKLLHFDAIIFNNNCGNRGRIFSDDQQSAFQQYIQNRGGFLAIHCAGAIRKEEGEFQRWYEGLIGARMLDHPKVQSARLVVEDTTHVSTQHLEKEWILTDEWHRFSDNPRERVNVLVSLDESSYEGEEKMGGDHPFIWYQYYDGGRSFFTSLGHSVEIYHNPNYQKMVEQAIQWIADQKFHTESMPPIDGLLLDLNADHGVKLEDGNKVMAWENQVQGNVIKSFTKRDIGRKVPGSGRPRLKLNEPQLNGHNTIVFHRQELVNHEEDALDHLVQGSGYTWFLVMSAYEQVRGKPGVNSFFGNLRNTNLDKKGQFEGFWAGLGDGNEIWMSSRNGLERGLWNKNSPRVMGKETLEKSRYYLIMGRMGAGIDTVNIELFVNSIAPVAKLPFPVNPKANPSKMAIGQERDAINHPGAESFDGEIARFLVFERPLTDDELKKTADHLIAYYGIRP